MDQPAVDQSARARRRVPHERSPVDVLRLVVAAVALVVLVLIVVVFGDTLISFLSQLLQGVQAIPQWMLEIIVVGSRLLTTALFVGGLVAALATRRLRLLVTTLAAAIVGAAVFGLVNSLVDTEAAPIAALDASIGTLSNQQYPTAVGLAVIAAVATAAAPWLTRRWRRAVWTVVVFAAASRFVTAPLSLDSAAALIAGSLAGSLVLVVLGGPVRRPTVAEAEEGLRGVGVDLATLEPAAVDARGSTPYFGTTTDGTRLFVKVLGEDERSADLLFRAYRRIAPHDLGDERSFSTLRRTVEHEALVALTADQMGVRTPPFVAFAAVEPDAFLLAYQAIAGTSLDGVEPDRLDEPTVAAVWDQVARLRRHRVAHRDLRLANLFLADDGQVWIIDFGFSELAASDLLLATDLAELLASLTVAIGPERAVAAGTAAVGAEALATAAPRLRPFALSGATRTAMKARAGLLDQLRALVAPT
jgi:undecaprenyl-diphosphatase